MIGIRIISPPGPAFVELFNELTKKMKIPKSGSENRIVRIDQVFFEKTIDLLSKFSETFIFPNIFLENPNKDNKIIIKNIVK